METRLVLTQESPGSTPGSRIFNLSLMNLLELIIYTFMIIIDTLILSLLQVFNPYYGSNAPEEVFENTTDIYMKVSNKESTDFSIDELLNISKTMHYCLWTMIVCG